VAGKVASPFMSPYAMSKHALEAMSESLRRELLVHGIDVIIVGPGAIRTPIWAKADDLDVDKYKSTEYYDMLVGMKKAMLGFGAEGLDAEDVGALVLHILTTPKPKTRYPILRKKFVMWTLPQILPKRMVDAIIARRFGMKPRSA
jgi:short-subunit dehydrogenase